MDLLNPKVNINLSGDQWRIYARNEPHPPHFVGDKADIAESLVTEGCNINGKLWYTVLFSGVTVEEGAELNSAVVMKNTVIKKAQRSNMPLSRKTLSSKKALSSAMTRVIILTRQNGESLW